MTSRTVHKVRTDSTYILHLTGVCVECLTAAKVHTSSPIPRTCYKQGSVNGDTLIEITAFKQDTIA